MNLNYITAARRHARRARCGPRARPAAPRPVLDGSTGRGRTLMIRRSLVPAGDACWRAPAWTHNLRRPSCKKRCRCAPAGPPRRQRKRSVKLDRSGFDGRRRDAAPLAAAQSEAAPASAGMRALSGGSKATERVPHAREELKYLLPRADRFSEVKPRAKSAAPPASANLGSRPAAR